MIKLKRLSLLNVNIDTQTEKEFVLEAEKYFDDESQHMIFTPNPEMIVEAQKNKEFLDVLNKSDMNIPDGIGLLWGSRFINLPIRFKSIPKLSFVYTLWQAFYSLLTLIIYPNFCRKFIPDRVSGSDFFWKLIDTCNKKNKRVFLLGALPGVADIVRDKLQTIYPKLQVAGTFAGSPDKLMEDEICYVISNSSADLLFVAYGAPSQEMWINRNLNKLKTVKLAIGVGGTFDFIAGKRKRAPLLIRRFGLEWLFRLFLTPSRYIRIYNATFKFVILVLREREARYKEY